MDRPTVSSVSSSVYRVPTDRPEADGTLSWSQTTVVVAHVSAGDTTGLGWTYGTAGCKAIIDDELTPAVVGADPFEVGRIHEAMVRACRNIGRLGAGGHAISAVDIAVWDLKARLLGLPLSDLFAPCHGDVPVYGSGGFTTYDDEVTAAQIERWVGDLQIPRVKIKIGEAWGSRVERDLGRVALTRKVAGDGVEIFVDANGGYSLKQALCTGRRMAEEYDVVWFEEPVSSDDLSGLAHLREMLALDVTAGEYGYTENYFAAMVGAGAVDCLQIDVTRCGGYTSWLRAAAIAQAAGLEVSGHCAPNLHAHVASAVPNLRHVEYFHDHVRCDSMLFEGTLVPVNGSLVLDGRGGPGHGMSIRDAGASQFRIG